jgi:hypothetical protein
LPFRRSRPHRLRADASDAARYTLSAVALYLNGVSTNFRRTPHRLFAPGGPHEARAAHAFACPTPLA